MKILAADQWSTSWPATLNSTLEPRDPPWSEVHINQNTHQLARGNSRPCARFAAYASASLYEWRVIRPESTLPRSGLRDHIPLFRRASRGLS